MRDWTQHLTEDQVTAIVIDGRPAASCRDHLERCAGCREQLERELALFGSALDAFNASSMAWSRARRPPSLGAAQAASQLWFSPAALALAAALLAVALAPAWQAQRQAAPSTEMAAMVDSPAEIAQDNELMQSVSVALDPGEPSPLDEYEPSGSHVLGEPAAWRIR